MKKSTLILSVLLAIIMTLTNCGTSSNEKNETRNEKDTTKKAVNDSLVVDSILLNIEKKPTNIEVTIGKQAWMSYNLDVLYFRNGDPIPIVKDSADWEEAGKNKQPACCYYQNKAAYGEKFGVLYNWYAVNDKRGLAPKGWHVPSDKEWTKLIKYLGGYSIAGNKMKSTQGWKSYDGKIVCSNCKSWDQKKKASEQCPVCKDKRMIEGVVSGNGNNSSGFTGLPGGYRSGDGTFNSIGKYGNWWSSTKDNTYDAWYRNLPYDDGLVFRIYYFKQGGMSVRCLRD
jgi:uncharacterized protein (TIGR02145 family)